MNDNELLTLFKYQIQIMTDVLDPLLTHTLNAAKQMVSREGIVDDGSVEYYQIVVMQAAYLYNRRDTNDGEPRQLRFAKNNLLFAQKVNET